MTRRTTVWLEVTAPRFSRAGHSKEHVQSAHKNLGRLACELGRFLSSHFRFAFFHVTCRLGCIFCMSRDLELGFVLSLLSSWIDCMHAHGRRQKRAEAKSLDWDSDILFYLVFFHRPVTQRFHLGTESIMSIKQKLQQSTTIWPLNHLPHAPRQLLISELSECRWLRDPWTAAQLNIGEPSPQASHLPNYHFPILDNRVITSQLISSIDSVNFLRATLQPGDRG